MENQEIDIKNLCFVTYEGHISAFKSNKIGAGFVAEIARSEILEGKIAVAVANQVYNYSGYSGYSVQSQCDSYERLLDSIAILHAKVSIMRQAYKNDDPEISNHFKELIEAWNHVNPENKFRVQLRKE